MDQRRSLCGEGLAHASHGFWAAGYTVWNECPGWTATEAATCDLIEQMNGVCREAGWPAWMPAGVRLECHPEVVYHLTQMFMPSYAEFTAAIETGDDNLLKPQIPVTAVAAMERGAWKLSSDAGVIAEGMIPGELASECALSAPSRR